METGTVPMTAAEKMQPLFAELRDVPGVEAIFRSRDGRVLYAVAREHDAIDWARLVEVEREIQEAGDPELTIAVRAHQGREPRVMFEGLEQL
jgi:hypothetical protein